MPSTNLEKIYYIPLLIDLLISNNFSSMTFFTDAKKSVKNWLTVVYFDDR